MFDKAHFQHNMVYGEYRYLPRRTYCAIKLCNKAFSIASNPQHNEWQQGLPSTVYKSVDKMSRDTTSYKGTEIISED